MGNRRIMKKYVISNLRDVRKILRLKRRLLMRT